VPPQTQNLKPWKPGQSGNPTGRPKSFASKIRTQTRNGEEMVEFALGVWRNETLSLKDRWPAFVWLTEYAYGKAPSFAPIEDGDPLALDGYDKAISDIVDELAARREAGAAGEAERRTVALDRARRADSA
jgi:hypothetical protein